MKAEAVRRASQDKVAHGGERRESERVVASGERRESKRVASGERRESKRVVASGERRGSERVASGAEPARDRRDSRWDEHRRARRAELVEATVRAVGKHGAGVGMEEIAAEAGTSKTVVYRHFADRSELYVAVCTRVAAQLGEALQTAMASNSEPRQMVTALVETYLAFLEADPELYRFVVAHPLLDRPVDADPVSTLSDLVGEQAAALVATALEQAGRDPAAAAPWGHGLVGLVRSAADWWLRTDRPMLRQHLAEHLTELAWAGLSGVLASTNARPTEEEQ
ncbi:TetR family transcriptional regulator [Blastococcus sp. SYSU D00820]